MTYDNIVLSKGVLNDFDWKLKVSYENSANLFHV